MESSKQQPRTGYINSQNQSMNISTKDNQNTSRDTSEEMDFEDLNMLKGADGYVGIDFLYEGDEQDTQ